MTSKSEDTRVGPFLKLTEAEEEVARRLQGAESYTYIAKALHVSVNTIKTHAKSVYRKLGISCPTQPVRLHGSNARAKLREAYAEYRRIIRESFEAVVEIGPLADSEIAKLREAGNPIAGDGIYNVLLALCSSDGCLDDIMGHLTRLLGDVIPVGPLTMVVEGFRTSGVIYCDCGHTYLVIAENLNEARCEAARRLRVTPMEHEQRLAALYLLEAAFLSAMADVRAVIGAVKAQGEPLETAFAQEVAA